MRYAALASSEEFKNLNPLVVGIGDEDSIGLIDKNRCRQPEFSWSLSSLAKIEEKLPSMVEDLDRIEDGVRHIDMPFRIEGDSLRIGEFAPSISVFSEQGEKLTLRIKNLYPKI